MDTQSVLDALTHVSQRRSLVAQRELKAKERREGERKRERSEKEKKRSGIEMTAPKQLEDR